MAHPMAGQAQSSLKRRLRALNASAGKSHGASNMYKKRSYPKKNAGSSTPMTISGGSSRARADRMASGGSVRRRRGHSTTNIIISHAGGQGGTGAGGGGATARPAPPVPVPVPRPVPVPAGAAPVGPGPAGPAPMPPRPVVPAAGPAPMPVRPPMPAPAGPPPGAMPMRPPGMAAGGSVKKAAKGGFLRDANSPKAGDAYPGFPHSPTSKTKSTVSAHKKGGVVAGFKRGGVARRADGGPASAGGAPIDPQQLLPDATLAGAMNTIGTSLGGGGPGPLRADGSTGGGGGGAVSAPSSGGGGGGSSDVGGDTEVTIGQQRSGGASLGPLRAIPPNPNPDNKKSGGGVKKLQMGGMSSLGGQQAPQQQAGGLFGPAPGRAPTPAIQGPPTISGRPARPAMPLTVPQPPSLGARLQRPAPGMTVGYKKGGPVHDDEAQDRKLIKKMISEEDKAEGMKKGGGVSRKVRDWGKGQSKTSGGSMAPRLSPGEKYHQQGKGYADGGLVHGAGSAAGRLARSKVSGKAEL